MSTHRGHGRSPPYLSGFFSLRSCPFRKSRYVLPG
nr:MAG TPA: hypothetical protein [Caudoviricetes sp.]